MTLSRTMAVQLPPPLRQLKAHHLYSSMNHEMATSVDDDPSDDEAVEITSRYEKRSTGSHCRRGIGIGPGRSSRASKSAPNLSTIAAVSYFYKSLI